MKAGTAGTILYAFAVPGCIDTVDDGMKENISETEPGENFICYSFPFLCYYESTCKLYLTFSNSPGCHWLSNRNCCVP